MKKYFLGLLTAILVGSAAFAEPPPAEIRVKNREPGYCCWCCLETLGAHQGIHKLKNLARDRENDPDFVYGVQRHPNGPIVWYKEAKNGGSQMSVRSKLDSMGVKYKITNNDRDHLKAAAEGKGGVVFFKAGVFGPPVGHPKAGAHAVIISYYGEKEVRIIDPNDLKEKTYTREWFENGWEGTTITLIPPVEVAPMPRTKR